MKIRYYGHLGQQTGYGVAAAELCRALLLAGVELEVRTIESAPTYWPERFATVKACVRLDRELTPAVDAVIVHTLPTDCHQVLGFARGSLVQGVKEIAYTTWEAPQAPIQIAGALHMFEQIWVPSRSNEHAFARMQPRVRVLPHAFDPTTLAERRRPMGHRRELPFRFYYLGAWSERKNPAGLIRAFAQAFTPEDHVHVELIMQCSNAGMHPDALRELAGPMASKVIPYTGRWGEALTDTGVADLHMFSDCYVTATRGEAWNLPAFDAMLAGRHVIAPAGQGTDDYLRDTSADLYPMKPWPGHGWPEPDTDALVTLMQRVYANKTSDLTLRYNPVERYGYQAVAQLALTYLTEKPV